MSARVTVHQLNESNATLNVLDMPHVGVGVWGYILPLNSSQGETYVFQNERGHFALVQFSSHEAFEEWYKGSRGQYPIVHRVIPGKIEPCPCGELV